jgi:GT2 family glycosyltransferase
MAMPKIAICVVTYNSAPLIKDLVASLPAGAAGTDWCLVFADNASSDDTVSEIRHHAPDAVLVNTGGNLGYSAGINAAVRAAGLQDAYLILNADVRLSAGCVATLAAAISERVGITVPRLSDANGNLIWSMRRKPTVLRAWADAIFGAERVGKWPVLGEVVTSVNEYRKTRRTDWAEGSTQLVSAACWRACGPWDESFFLYSEETDFNLRAREHGYETWFVPAAAATHLEGGSGTSPRQQALLFVNRVRLFRRSHSPAATGLFWLALVTRELGRVAIGNGPSRTIVRSLLSPRRLRQRPSAEWLVG